MPRRLLFSLIALSLLLAPACRRRHQGDGAAVRIVSLPRASTVLLCELGARQQLVAVADSRSGLPDAVSALPRVGRSMAQPSPESILALNPDLVCCSATQAEALARAGLKTFVVDAQGLEGVLDLTLRLGRAVGRSVIAESLVAGFRTRMKGVAERVKGMPAPLVYFEGQGKSRGHGTLTHDLITLAGGRNLAGEGATLGVRDSYPLISTEVLIQRDPDVILLDGSEGDPMTVAKARPGWANLKAVRTGRVYASRITYTDWTPQCIEGLEAFARFFHGDAKPGESSAQATPGPAVPLDPRADRGACPRSTPRRFK